MTDRESSGFLVLTTVSLSLNISRSSHKRQSLYQFPKSSRVLPITTPSLNLSPFSTVVPTLRCGGATVGHAGRQTPLLLPPPPLFCAHPNMGVNSSICVHPSHCEIDGRHYHIVSCIVFGPSSLACPRSVMMIDPKTTKKGLITVAR